MQQPFYSHYTGQPVVAGNPSWELDDFIRAQFDCLHTLANGNWCIL